MSRRQTLRWLVVYLGLSVILVAAVWPHFPPRRPLVGLAPSGRYDMAVLAG
jgi:hypothetical protein